MRGGAALRFPRRRPPAPLPGEAFRTGRHILEGRDRRDLPRPAIACPGRPDSPAAGRGRPARSVRGPSRVWTRKGCAPRRTEGGPRGKEPARPPARRRASGAPWHRAPVPPQRGLILGGSVAANRFDEDCCQENPVVLPSAVPDPRMRRCRLGVVDIRSPCQTASCRGRGHLFTVLSVTSRFQCGGQ